MLLARWITSALEGTKCASGFKKPSVKTLIFTVRLRREKKIHFATNRFVVQVEQGAAVHKHALLPARLKTSQGFSCSGVIIFSAAC